MSVSAAERHATGSVRPEEYAEVGFNYRMTDLQAAVGLAQLDRLDAIIERRRELALLAAVGYRRAHILTIVMAEGGDAERHLIVTKGAFLNVLSV